MADRSHYRPIAKCECGKELRSKDERDLGMCRKCIQEDADLTELDERLDYPLSALEMRSDG